MGKLNPKQGCPSIRTPNRPKPAAVLILIALRNFCRPLVTHLLSKCRFTAIFDEVDDKVSEAKHL